MILEAETDRLVSVFRILCVAILIVGLASSGKLGAIVWAALMYGPILWASLIVHAMGSTFGARSVGGDCDEVIFWPLGAFLNVHHGSGPAKDLWVQIAGPLTHLPQAAFWALLSVFSYHAWTKEWTTRVDYPLTYENNHFVHRLFVGALWLNVSCFILNTLIPAVPLNGARLLADLLMIGGVSTNMTAKIVVGLSTFIGGAMIVAGALRIWGSLMGILIGVFIIWSAWHLWQAIKDGQADKHPMFISNASDPPGRPTGTEKIVGARMGP